MEAIKEFANKIKKVIGLKSYNRFVERNSGIDNLRWLINSGVKKRIDELGKKIVTTESDSDRWWIIFHDFYMPLLNYYFTKDKNITQEIITIFCETWRSYEGTSLFFWSQELDMYFSGDTKDLLPFFPEPERNILRRSVDFAEKTQEKFRMES